MLAGFQNKYKEGNPSIWIWILMHMFPHLYQANCVRVKGKG